MKLFISDFTGICNRMECLAYAYLVRDYFGHEIYLDWPELHSLRILGTAQGKMRLHHRWKSLKVRGGDESLFASLGSYQHIILRGWPGAPAPALARAAKEVAQNLRIHPRLGLSIRKLFSSHSGRRVVGVHLRRGDFTGAEATRYDIRTNKHPSVPDWWFAWVMRRLLQAQPETLFYVSGTGDPRSYSWLADFPLLFLDEPSPYTYKGESHSSKVDPVADLFALACCPTIIATPASSFSHWAAHLMGSPSLVLMPPFTTDRESPQMVRLSRPCSTLDQWTLVSRTGEGTISLSDACPLDQKAEFDWF